MSAGNPKGWPKSEMLNYGIPKPVFVIPAAYVNKQAAEWPPGHTIDPCVIPPPEVTLVDGVLTIGGTNISIAVADIQIYEAGVFTTVGLPQYTTSIPEGDTTNYEVVITVKNIGTILAPSVRLFASSHSILENILYPVTYTGGATGPASILGSAVKNYALGGPAINMPAGSSYTLRGPAKFTPAGTLVNYSLYAVADGLLLKNPQKAYQSFAVNVTAAE